MPEVKEFEFDRRRYLFSINPDGSYSIFNSEKQPVTVREHNRRGFQEAAQRAVAGSRIAAEIVESFLAWEGRYGMLKCACCFLPATHVNLVHSNFLTCACEKHRGDVSKGTEEISAEEWEAMQVHES